MESCTTRLLALISALALSSASVSQARPPAPIESPPVVQPTVGPTAQPSTAEQIAWDCVPSYWWGYWTWAWQPCAWIDRSYVEGTIGAVAQASPSVRAPLPREP